MLNILNTIHVSIYGLEESKENIFTNVAMKSSSLYINVHFSRE